MNCDVITFESCSSGRADDVDHIRGALKHIPAERLVITSDCGMGREGMSRRHARYKIASIVQGTNIVRKELGLPEAECRMTEGRYSLPNIERGGGWFRGSPAQASP